MVKQSEQTVDGEIREIFNDTGDDNLAHLQATIARVSATSPQYYYLLQDRDGKFLAGNLANADPVIGVHDWEGGFLHDTAQTPPTIHGIGMRTLDGAYLFVGARAYESSKMHIVLTRYFLWIMGSTSIALLLGGLFMSSRMLSRVEAISRTSRDIISGDLQRRVPIRGTDDEFDHLAVSLNAMLDRIQHLMDGLRQVTNDIAHDLRTPLTRLRQKLEYSRNKATSVEEFQTTLDESIQHVDSILSVFSGLLRIAQIEAGIRRSGFKKIDLSEILLEVTGLYRPVFDEKNQALVADISSNLVMSGDRELLTQLFVNIIDNATKHTPSHSVVTVKAIIERLHILVEVTDNGPGIPEAHLAKVFQRFYRLEQSRSTPGNGLGLSLVEAVVEQHDAQIELLDNRPGVIIRLTFISCPVGMPAPL
jgi:signal transduction histidine kinase